MTECSRCGQCCEAIPLAVSQMEMRVKPPWEIDERTRRWVLEELVPISPREARRVAPWRDREELMMDAAGNWTADYPSFYRCLNFDTETRLCTAHDDLPPTCSQFPYYNGTIPSAVNLPPRCSYRADLGQPIEEWEPVQITRHR